MERILKDIINQLEPSLQVEYIPTAVSDLMVTDPATDMKFVIAVKVNNMPDSILFQYLDTIAEAIYDQGAPRIPLLLCKVDVENHSANIALIVEWRFNTPLLNKQINFIPLDTDHWPIILDNIKAADSVIRVLNETNCLVVKHIRFSYPSPSYTGRAQIVYLRTFRPDYTMAPKEYNTAQEQFELYLNGIPEENYPCDEIDRLILSAVRSSYGDAETRSSLLIFSTELDDLRRQYRNGRYHDATVSFIPTSVEQGGMGRVKILQLSLDLFSDAFTGQVVPSQFYSSRFDVVNTEQINEFNHVLETSCRSIRSMII